jgi:hypothetical protein
MAKHSQSLILAALVVALVIALPLALIWSLNTLFGLDISHGLSEWTAAAILLVLAKDIGNGRRMK